MDQFILVWIVFAAAAASIAKSKGRSVPLWIVISLVLGPFATLIVALMKTTTTGDKKYH